MTDAPERIWAWGHWYGGSQYYARHQADGGSENEFERTLYLRADTTIPRAEADAMVAAVVERIAQERDAEARYWSEACNDDERVYHEVHAKKIRALTPADASAAFEQAIERAKLQSALDSLSSEIEVQKEVEQAVREAREEGFTSGRDKGFEEGRAMAHQHDKIFDEETTALQVREAVEAERERADKMETAIRLALQVLKTSKDTPTEDPDYQDVVDSLGEMIGFGALMSAAEIGWRNAIEGFAGAEFVCGPCRSQYDAAIETLRAAIRAPQETSE